MVSLHSTFYKRRTILVIHSDKTEVTEKQLLKQMKRIAENLTDELNQFERQAKRNRNNLSSLATDSSLQLGSKRILTWDQGKYFKNIMITNLSLKHRHIMHLLNLKPCVHMLMLEP